MIDLYNDDCLKVMATLPDESVDLIVTDPPYRVTSRGNCGNMGGYFKTDIAMSGKIFENNFIKPSQYMPEFYRILKDKTILYLMTNNLNLQEMINEGTKCGFHFIKSIIWDKRSKICGRYYMGCYEHILLFRKGGDRPINNCDTPDILSIPIEKLKDENGNNLHDTEKPVELMKILVENSSNKGDLVLEPFMGIGSTVIACKQLERDCIGIEIDKKYFDIASHRISDEKVIKTEQVELW